MDPVGVMFNLHLINAIDDVENRRRRAIFYRNLRDNSNPFEVPDFNFIKQYRLSKDLVISLIEEIREFVGEGSRSTKIPLHIKVLVALSFYAVGGYQTSIGQDVSLAVSQPAVSRIIKEISIIFSQNLLQRYVTFPTAEDFLTTKRGFMENLNFPNTIGAIDCCHVAIVSPPVDDVNYPAVAYLNRKGYHSLNVQVICDSNACLLAVNARFPGATHDAAIWRTSNIQRYLKNLYENGHRNFFLLGDSGYPLQPWLMTPIPGAPVNTPEGQYTARHCSARNIIERCFGILKQRFRCLLKHRVLHYDHPSAGHIIYACAVLHNICRKNNVPDIFDDEDDDDGNHAELPHEENAEHINNDAGPVNWLEEGRLVRRQLINTL